MASSLYKTAAILIGTVCAVVPLQLVTPGAVTTVLAQASTKIPVVTSAGLRPDIDVPWSRPVRVEDPFEGNFLAVFDYNTLQGYWYRSRKVISLWSRNSIRVLLNSTLRQCDIAYSASYLGSDCVRVNSADTVRQLYIKVGDRVLRLAGENGNFAVGNDVARVLKQAPTTENVKIRLVLEGGETVDSEIGKKTVQAWRTIY